MILDVNVRYQKRAKLLGTQRCAIVMHEVLILRTLEFCLPTSFLFMDLDMVDRIRLSAV